MIFYWLEADLQNVPNHAFMWNVKTGDKSSAIYNFIRGYFILLTFIIWCADKQVWLMGNPGEAQNGQTSKPTIVQILQALVSLGLVMTVLHLVVL